MERDFHSATNRGLRQLAGSQWDADLSVSIRTISVTRNGICTEVTVLPHSLCGLFFSSVSVLKRVICASLNSLTSRKFEQQDFLGVFFDAVAAIIWSVRFALAGIITNCHQDCAITTVLSPLCHHHCPSVLSPLCHHHPPCSGDYLAPCVITWPGLSYR